MNAKLFNTAAGTALAVALALGGSEEARAQACWLDANLDGISDGVWGAQDRGSDPDYYDNELVCGPNARSDGVQNTVIGANAKAYAIDPDGTGTGPDAPLVDDVRANYATAVGNQAAAMADATVALGRGALAEGAGAVAIGATDHNQTIDARAVNQDTSPTAAAYAVAIGYQTKATGANSVSLGERAVASIAQSIAIGSNARAETAIGAIAIGADAWSSAANAVALGYDSIADVANTVSIGRADDPATTDTNEAITRKIVFVTDGAVEEDSTEAVTGNQLWKLTGRVATLETTGGGIMATDAATPLAKATVQSGIQSSVALGFGSVANAKDTVSVGKAESSPGAGDGIYRKIVNVADGGDPQDAATYGQVFALQFDRVGTPTLAVTAPTATGTFSVALGSSANAVGNFSLALGHTAVTNGLETLALGRNATANGNYSLAIGGNPDSNGFGAQSTGDNSIAIGGDSWAKKAESIVIGNGAQADEINSTIIGYQASSTASSAVAIGHKASGGQSGVAIGVGAKNTHTNGVAVGQSAQTSQHGVAIGYEAKTTAVSSIAVGFLSQANKKNSVALGSGAKTDHEGAVALGTQSVTADDYTVSLGGYYDPQIGRDFNGDGLVDSSDLIRRRITNVAEGAVNETSSDAVTGKQLHKVDQKVDALQKNFATFGEGMSTSITLGNGSVTSDAYVVSVGGGQATEDVNNDGVTDGLDIVTRRITNVAAGDAESDAATVGQLGAYVKTTELDGKIDTRLTTNGYATQQYVADQNFATQSHVADNYLSASRASFVSQGTAAKAAGGSSMALGASAFASSDASVQPVLSSGFTGSLAVGSGALAMGNGALAIGIDAQVIHTHQSNKMAENASAVGFSAGATGNNASAFGASADALGDSSTALGASAKAKSNGSIAIGANSDADTIGGIAIGQNALVKIENPEESPSSSVAIGANSMATEDGTVSFGSAIADQGEGVFQRRLVNVAAGTNSTDAVNKAQMEAALNGLAAGQIPELAYFAAEGTGTATATVTGEGATALGSGANASASDAMALGSGATVFFGATSALAVGKNAAAESVRATAIGENAVARGTDAFALGNNTFAKSVNSLAIGGSARATNLRSTAIGSAAQASGIRSVAIGDVSQARAENATAIGYATLAKEVGSTAVGANAQSQFANATAIGANATTTAANQLALGGAGSSVRIGDIDASTAAQNDGQIYMVTVDENGTLGKGDALGLKGALSAVENTMRYVAAVSDAQFAALSSDVTALGGRVDDLEFQLGDLDETTRGGIATAMAMGGQMIVPDSTVSVSVNGSTYRGEQGFSGGITARVAPRVYVSGSIAGSTVKKSTGGRVGVAFGF